ncbi:TlpA family protein disulfide reductase [Campylobacter canadensis]|uniref:TlpA family protein disulfide reductase n=1 Tax=Campylobacter canadensis TaxID=449520 RepID=A0ABS7WS61_9BACT|nr:TlpA disulfide reductase family protein [Campylobacter canadensis]MBZ7987595.1 TlpA family protein disulfide reductase [Campylobacter canadensis]MBZ7994970.1 TlpA family protein disulfide reductase [Campylobacter canadensis]MBZ7996880.1 TlpA family protein disulfide reductase [Campylobacter canadensis]MBZ7998759.1 TlpA family protein disulfide reductase [Campylobacter canadensis]MBZ8000359.1 TlpA family protein disulfide reductase [Campylobacter canadensis]
MKFIKILFFLVFLCACSNNESSENTIKVGDKITLKSWDKQEITLQRTQNGFKLLNSDKILLIDIFGTFCPPCKAEAPALFELQQAKKDSLIILGLSYAESVSDEKLKEFTQNYNAYYFLTNDKRADDIVELIANDIKYTTQIQLPFKVMIKDGKYEKFNESYFILGKADEGLLRSSINKIEEKK